MQSLLKSYLYYFIASILVVLLAKYIHSALIYLDNFYTYVNALIAPIFNQVGLGKIVHQTLVLILIPIIIIGIPSLVYRLIKHQTMPYFANLTWATWLILVLCITMIH
ncbi:MAG: hypothetical protein A3F18_00260 [Legionellales bacterium RIFCSPHIGHO2_12_FULL_37_14]|nr:MAG: hypothetical protein A3F18_00260 [Legionellales bacterium RIFCSPHIGHO2_12_FULL_37_14]